MTTPLERWIEHDDFPEWAVDLIESRHSWARKLVADARQLIAEDRITYRNRMTLWMAVRDTDEVQAKVREMEEPDAD